MLSGQDDLPLSLLCYEPLDCYFLIRQVRDTDSNPVRHPHTQLYVRPLSRSPGLLVLPLLPGKVQEVPGTGRPRRQGVSAFDFDVNMLDNNLNWDIHNFCRFEVDDPDAQQDPPY